MGVESLTWKKMTIDMQTFLPYDNFSMSARVLDNKRLGKQRVEALQILKVLNFGPYQMLVNYKSDQTPIWESCTQEEFNEAKRNKTPRVRKTPWYNHPAVQMWKGYSNGLFLYLEEMVREWKLRGGVDTCLEKAKEFKTNGPVLLPDWLGNESFHLSHQSNLLRKHPSYYGMYFMGVSNDLPYIWPSKDLVYVN